MSEPNAAQNRLLGALTLTALKHLGGDTLTFDAHNNLCPRRRVVRVGEIAFVEKPADDRSPKRIDVYQVRSASGAVFKLDPARLLYCLQWQHNGEPPDFDLVLLQDEPEHWVGAVNMTLLGELRRRAPEAIDWSRMGDVIPMLDAFEATRESAVP